MRTVVSSNCIDKLRVGDKIDEALYQELCFVTSLLVRRMKDQRLEFPIKVTIELEEIPYCGLQLVAKTSR